MKWSAAEKMSKMPAPQDDSSKGEQPKPPQKGGGDLREVFEEIRPGLRRFLLSKLPQADDAEDCLQAVMIAALENSKEIPASARRAWLYRVASNEAALWWRKRKTHDRVMEKQADYTAETNDDGVHLRLETQETLEEIQQAISELPELTREMLRLRIHENMTFQSIAETLDLPLGTVLTRMRRTMEQLRDQFDRDR